MFVGVYPLVLAKETPSMLKVVNWRLVRGWMLCKQNKLGDFEYQFKRIRVIKATKIVFELSADYC